MNTIYHITGKKIDPARCEVLYNRPFTESSLFEDFDVASGSWYVDDRGGLTGRIGKNAGGMIYSKENYGCDVLMDFRAGTVPPCANDLNFVFRTSGWDAEKQDAGPGYIAGIGGWWVNKTGIEKYPSCRPTAMTPCFRLEAGREYHVFAGSVGGHCFLFVDGQLIIELFDPSPEDLEGCGKFGFGAYASHVRYRDLKVYRAEYEAHTLSYPEQED